MILLNVVLFHEFGFVVVCQVLYIIVVISVVLYFFVVGVESIFVDGLFCFLGFLKMWFFLFFDVLDG